MSVSTEQIPNVDDGNADPVFIGVAGGTASGKTTLCNNIMSYIRTKFPLYKKAEERICIISQDSFYRDLTPEESKLAEVQEFNFDDPCFHIPFFVISAIHSCS